MDRAARLSKTATGLVAARARSSRHDATTLKLLRAVDGNRDAALVAEEAGVDCEAALELLSRLESEGMVRRVLEASGLAADDLDFTRPG